MRSMRPGIIPLFFLGSRLMGLLKISFLVGSYALFFSGVNCFTPLAGAFCGLSGSTLLFLLAICTRIVLYGGLFPVSYLVHFVPGLFASYYWASRSMLIRVMVPAFCMMLFVVHPIGGQVWFYALYWLIPIGLYLVNREYLFLTALGSTFTAHAVGSVIWLYTMPTDTVLWYRLMPIVLVERILFASGLMVIYMLISWLMHWIAMVRKKWVVSVA